MPGLQEAIEHVRVGGWFFPTHLQQICESQVKDRFPRDFLGESKRIFETTTDPLVHQNIHI